MPEKYTPDYSGSWALIIGLDKYEHIGPLEYATSDANAIAETLESRFRFPKQNITLLINEEATFAAIRKNFLTFSKKTKDNDRLLVFFAGHGHTISGSRGEVGYLIPYDGDTDNLDTLIRWDELTRNADLIPAKHALFIMDACYGGLALPRSFSRGERFLNDMLRRRARQVLTAGKADEVVSDGGGVRPNHSIFTAHLLNGLEGMAATEQGLITASGVMAYVYRQVSMDKESHQTPHYGFIEGDGDFIFNEDIRETILDASSEGAGRQSTANEEKVSEKDILIKPSQEILDNEQEQESSLVVTLKDLLSEPSKRIILDDFVTDHVKAFLAATDLRSFPVQDSAAQHEDFVERIHKYEELSRNIQQIVILLAKWANKDQLYLLERIFVTLADADKGSAGVVLWLKLTWYPLHLLLYVAGIAALSAKNFDALKIILTTPVRHHSSNKNLPLAIPVMSEVHELQDWFKKIPGYEQKYVPRSEYLFKVLQPVVEDTLFLGKSYETLFDNFEVFAAIAYADLSESDWGPIGRFGWKHGAWHGESTFDAFVSRIKNEGQASEIFRAGLFGGSLEQFTKRVDTYRPRIEKLSWM